MPNPTRPKKFDLSSVPLAGGFAIMTCDDRSHIHLVLFDESDTEPVMQITLSRKQLQEDVVQYVEEIFGGTSFGH